MVQWINRVALTLPRNGTTSHIIDPSNATGGGTVVGGTAFTPTAGSLLVIVTDGAVTSTTPSGWTLPTNGSAINNTGLYLFTKTAASGTNATSTTHNGSNYTVGVEIYEFPSGSTVVAVATSVAVAIGGANPAVTAGTHTLLMAAKAAGVLSGSISITTTWGGTPTPTKLLDAGAATSGTDGYWLTTAYADDTGATTFTPTGAMSVTGTTASQTEALTWSMNVPTGGGITADSSLTETATLTATASRATTGQGTRAETVTRTATATRNTVAAASLAQIANVSSSATRTTTGQSTTTATVTLSADSTVTSATAAGATLANTVTVSASSDRTTTASAAQAATVTLTAAGTRVTAGQGATAVTVALSTSAGKAAATAASLIAAVATSASATTSAFTLRDITLTATEASPRFTSTEATVRFVATESITRWVAQETK